MTTIIYLPQPVPIYPQKTEEPRTKTSTLGVVEGNKIITFKCKEENQQWLIKDDIAMCVAKEEESSWWLIGFIIVMLIAAFIIVDLVRS